ncbi:MAG: SsrA-binding protein SmpB [Saprospiraceae bacterium]|jgi:SsrA-binding protein
MAEKKKAKKRVEIFNKRAAYDYSFLEKLIVGVVLQGTEIKSIRSGNVNLADAFCIFKGGELFIRNLFIAEYEFGNIANHEPRRIRKLLLKRQELKKLEKKVKEKGLTIVPVKLFIDDRGFAKMEIALAKGKKVYDKRATIKERESKVALSRIKKFNL